MSATSLALTLAAARHSSRLREPTRPCLPLCQRRLATALHSDTPKLHVRQRRYVATRHSSPSLSTPTACAPISTRVDTCCSLRQRPYSSSPRHHVCQRRYSLLPPPTSITRRTLISSTKTTCNRQHQRTRKNQAKKTSICSRLNAFSIRSYAFLKLVIKYLFPWNS